MIVVCISDTHSLTDNLQVPDGDILIHSGDFTNIGLKKDILKFNEFLGRLPHQYKIIIAGNHDLSLDVNNFDKLHWHLRMRFLELSARSEQKVIDLKEYLPNMKKLLTNVIYLEDSGVEIGGYKFWGSPWTPNFFGWAFMLEDDEEIASKWQLIPEDTDCLITHGPPRGILDFTRRLEHAGSKELLKTVQKIKPLYHIFGHIHEEYGIKKEGQTTYINASTCNRNYDPHNLNPPIVFELPSGMVERVGVEPTLPLVVVSR